MHLCCIYFGCQSLSLPQTWCLSQHGVLLLPTCLPGLKRPQALCRINSNVVLPLLTTTGANKTITLHIGTSYTLDFGFYSKGNVSPLDCNFKIRSKILSSKFPSLFTSNFMRHICHHPIANFYVFGLSLNPFVILSSQVWEFVIFSLPILHALDRLYIHL